MYAQPLEAHHFLRRFLLCAYHLLLSVDLSAPRTGDATCPPARRCRARSAARSFTRSSVSAPTPPASQTSSERQAAGASLFRAPAASRHKSALAARPRHPVAVDDALPLQRFRERSVQMMMRHSREVVLQRLHRSVAAAVCHTHRCATEHVEDVLHDVRFAGDKHCTSARLAVARQKDSSAAVSVCDPETLEPKLRDDLLNHVQMALVRSSHQGRDGG